MDNRRPPRQNPFGSRTYGDRPNRGPFQRPGQFQRNDGGRDGSRPQAGDRNQARGTNDPRVSDRRPGPVGNRSQDGGRGRYNPTGRFARAGQDQRRKPVQQKENYPPITSDLQITDGKYRGHLLENSLSPVARPTERKLREIVFKVASRRVRAGRFLDLGAGMGIIGLEALSRGAMLGTFVERSARMCTLIKKNLAALGIKDGHGEVVDQEISPFLKAMSRRKRNWDLVFMGTRCGGAEEDTYRFFGRGVPLAPGGLLLIEHASDLEFPERIGVLARCRTIAKDGSTITFYERKTN